MRKLIQKILKEGLSENELNKLKRVYSHLDKLVGKKMGAYRIEWFKVFYVESEKTIRIYPMIIEFDWKGEEQEVDVNQFVRKYLDRKNNLHNRPIRCDSSSFLYDMDVEEKKMKSKNAIQIK